MKIYIAIFVLLSLFPLLLEAQVRGGNWRQEVFVGDAGDSTVTVHFPPIFVFNRPIDLRRHLRLVDAVRKVYPLAQIAKAKLANMESELGNMQTEKAQRDYIKIVYKELKNEYTPILHRMTRSQGRVLLKLIDRETEYTAYEVLKDFKGGFSAGFWQGVSKIFGQDLKSKYEKDGEDRMIEQIIIYYEAGLL